MKCTAALLLFVSSLGNAGAFAPAPLAIRPKLSLADLPAALDLPAAATAVDAVTSGAAASGGGDPPLALLAAGIAGIVAVATLASSGKGMAKAPKASATAQAEPEPEPIDVSIPYDAAATLAYCQAKGVSSITDKADYESFRAAYEEATVAMVTLKKMQREVAAMEQTVASKQAALETTSA